MDEHPLYLFQINDPPIIPNKDWLPLRLAHESHVISDIDRPSSADFILIHFKGPSSISASNCFFLSVVSVTSCKLNLIHDGL